MGGFFHKDDDFIWIIILIILLLCCNGENGIGDFFCNECLCLAVIVFLVCSCFGNESCPG